MQTNIIVNLQVDGIHYWEGVTEHSELKEVDFLQYPHRHMFHITAKMSVSHDDRDVEIIMLKRKIIKYLYRYWNDTKNCYHFGGMSCEMIARELLDNFGLCYCSVLEDNENGAEIHV